MPSVDTLIRSLEQEGRQGGERSTGGFTLDRDKAREKMRLFQLPDPRAYVLELVQAAVIKGATKIRFDIDADDMRMTCDGQPFGVDDFEGIYNSLLAATDTPGADSRRQLALGLNAAMALNPRFIYVLTGDGREGSYLEMRPGKEDRFGPLDLSEQHLVGTRIHVKERFRPGLAMAFIRNIAGTLKEEQLLRERCRFATTEIDLEGTILSKGLTLPGAIAGIPIEEKELRGVIGLQTDPEATQAGLTLVKDGVRITTHFLDKMMPGLVAVIEGSALRKNVSQTDIVRDNAYTSMLRAIQLATWPLMYAYTKHAMADHASAPQQRTKRLLLWLLGRSVSIEKFVRLRSDQTNKELIHYLFDIPLWTSITGSPVTLEMLLDEHETHGDIVISHIPAEVALDSERSVLVVSKGTEILLNNLFDEAVVDWTDHIERAQKRERNRLAWNVRRSEPVLPSKGYIARRPIRAEGIAGEIGVSALPTDRISLRLITKGCLLVEIKAPFDVSGLNVLLEADFQPNDAYDNVVADETYGRAMVAVLNSLLPLFHGVARLDEQHAVHRSCLRSFLGAISQLGARQKLLGQLGVHPGQLEVLTQGENKRAWALKSLLFPERYTLEGSHSAHGLRFAKIFESWSGVYISLDTMETMLERYGVLRVVDASVGRPNDPGWLTDDLRFAAEEIARGSASDISDAKTLRRQPIVLIDKLARRLLNLLFDRSKLLEYGDACAYLLRAESFYHFKRPSQPWIKAKVVSKVQIREEHLQGELGLLSNDSNDSGDLITLFKEGRELGLAPLGIYIEGLTAAINDDRLMPDPEWDNALEDENTSKVRFFIARALVGLVDLVSRNIGYTDRKETSIAFLHDAAIALFPHKILRQVYDVRVMNESREAANLEHTILLQLCASTSVNRVVQAITTRLKRTATPTAESVAQGLVGLGSKEPPEILPGCLSWVDKLFPLESSADEGSIGFDERTLMPTPALKGAKLFCRHDGRRVSFGDVIDAFRATREVLFVREEVRHLSSGDRLILHAELQDLNTLRCIFGEGPVKEAGDWLEEQKRQWHLQKMPQLDEIALSSYEALVSVSVEGPNIFGALGFDAEHPGFGQQELTIRLCTDRREVGSTTEASPAALTAIVNDDNLEISQYLFEKNAEFPGKEARKSLLRSRLPALVEALCAAWPNLKGPKLSTARKHALDLLTFRWSESKENNEGQDRSLDGPLGRNLNELLSWSTRTLEGLEEPPWNELLELPLFPTVNGEHVSVGMLVRKHQAQELPVYYIPDESVRGDPLDEGTIILALGELEEQRLRELDFLPSSNYHKRWEKERKILTWLAQAPELPEVGELAAIHRLPVSLDDGLNGELIIPPARIPLGVFTFLPMTSFGTGGRLIEDKSISEFFPCGGVISGPRKYMTLDLDKVTLSRKMQDGLTKAVVTLYDTLCDRFEEKDFFDEQRINIARSYLAAAAIFLVRKKRTRSKNWVKLYQRLERLPLLELRRGPIISIELANKERPVELMGLGLWESQVTQIEPKPEEPPEETLPATISSPEKQAEVAKPTPARETKNPEPSEPKTITNIPPPPKTTPEDRLAEEVREQLRLIRNKNRELLNDFLIERICIDWVQDDRLVVFSSGKTIISRNHRSTETALERFEKDPLWVGFLLSAVYTAINEAHSKVTDSDEEQFLHLLTRLVSKGEVYL